MSINLINAQIKIIFAYGHNISVLLLYYISRKSNRCFSSNTGMYCTSTYSDMLDKKN